MELLMIVLFLWELPSKLLRFATGNKANSTLPVTEDSDQIPPRLHLDRILSGQTCSPISLYDFYMYLKFIAEAPQDLEFWMWYKDYERRWLKANNLPYSAYNTWSHSPSHVEIPQTLYSGMVYDMSREWTRDVKLKKNKDWPFPPVRSRGEKSTLGSTWYKLSIGPVANDLPAALRKKKTKSETDFDKFIKRAVHNHAHKDCAVCAIRAGKIVRAAGDSNDENSTTAFIAPKNLQLKDKHHLKELDRTADAFLRSGASRKLNIPDSMREQALEDITKSSCPSNLEAIKEHSYTRLLKVYHPHFIKLAMQHGSTDYICLATVAGISLIFGGIVLMGLLSSCHQHFGRWMGFSPLPFLFLGVFSLALGLSGHTYLLLMLPNRQVLPWEYLYENPNDAWRPRDHNTRCWFRKVLIFDKKLRLEDAEMRRLHYIKIFRSFLIACSFSFTITIFFLVAPIWDAPPVKNASQYRQSGV